MNVISTVFRISKDVHPSVVKILSYAIGDMNAQNASETVFVYLFRDFG